MTNAAKLLSIILITGMNIGAAHAIPLSDLLSGSTITAGDKLFDQWNLINNTASGVVADTSLIDVFALHDGGNEPGPGLHYDMNGQMNVTGDGMFSFSSLTFSYRVTILSPNEKIKDNSLYLTGAGITPLNAYDAGIYINEQVRDANSALLGDKEVELSAAGSFVINNPIDTALFPPQLQVHVTTDIYTWAVDTNDHVQFDSFEQRFSQIPEPGALGLFGLGLLTLLAARRRRESMM